MFADPETVAQAEDRSFAAAELLDLIDEMAGPSCTDGVWTYPTEEVADDGR